MKRPLALVLTFLAAIPAAKAGDIGVTTTNNTANYNTLVGGGGSGGRGPVAPAIAPGLPGAPSQHGENRFLVEADKPCIIRKPDGTVQIVVLRHIVSATKASTTTSRGGSLGVSLFSWGVSGSLNNASSTPNPPKEEFERYLDLTEAGQIVSCEAASDTDTGLRIRQEELRRAQRTLEVLRRGSVRGFAATEAAQDAYEDARKEAGSNHPKLEQADKLASQGRYEEATRLLQSH